jgi:hypothetical protein
LVAYPSVTQAQHRVSDAKVKGKSEFGETSRRWWQRKGEAQPAPVKPSTFPNPAARTQILPLVEHHNPTPPAAPQVLYRERPIDLDKAACNIGLAVNSSILNRWSATKLEEQLARHLKVVHALAQQELAEGQKMMARRESGEGAAVAAVEGIREVVHAEKQANGLAGVSVKAEVDTAAVGKELGAVWANAHALGDDTTQFQPITADMPDPRVKVTVVAASATDSPVHVPGDDLRPALPVDAAPLAAPLPRRGEITVLPAGDNDPSKSLNPLEESLLPGSWVQDEGSDTTGRFWWRVSHVRKSIGDDGPWTRVEFANSQHRNVDRGKTVTVLNPDAAARMLTEHVAQLAAKAEAAQADAEAAR